MDCDLILELWNIGDNGGPACRWTNESLARHSHHLYMDRLTDLLSIATVGPHQTNAVILLHSTKSTRRILPMISQEGAYWVVRVKPAKLRGTALGDLA